MDYEPLAILLIEDNPADAEMIRQMLAEVEDSPTGLEHVDRLSAGLDRDGSDVLNCQLLHPRETSRYRLL